MCVLCVEVLADARRGCWTPWSEVADSCESLGGCWEPNLVAGTISSLDYSFNCRQSLRHLLNCWVWLVSAINLYPSEGIRAVGEKVNSAELTTNSLSVLDYHCMGLHTPFSNLEYKCDCFSVKIMPFGDQFIRALVRNGGITWKCRLTVIRYF